MAEYGSFSEVRARLDEIVTEVRKKELSLEKSLDLYEEAIKLGNRAAELVDKPEFSPEELEQEAPEEEHQGGEALAPAPVQEEGAPPSEEEAEPEPRS
ncbi:MAG: exodeoxyribonuclease VII small subunit [Coriobacteriales bacterium]